MMGRPLDWIPVFGKRTTSSALAAAPPKAAPAL